MFSRLVFCLVLLSVLGVFGGATGVAAQATPAAQDPTPVVIDADMISDDWMATLFTLNDPQFAVQAITVAGTGFASCDAGVASALGLLALTEYGDVPVSCGSETPLVGDNAPPAEWMTTLETVEAPRPAGGRRPRRTGCRGAPHLHDPGVGGARDRAGAGAADERRRGARGHAALSRTSREST
jgi:hypothetical protein